MIDRQKGKLLFECDGCGTVEEFDGDVNFNLAWNTLKEKGWKTRKTGDVWTHACSRCEVSL